MRAKYAMVGVLSLCALYFGLSLAIADPMFLMFLLFAEAAAAHVLARYADGFRRWVKQLSPMVLLSFLVLTVNIFFGPNGTAFLEVTTPFGDFGISLQALYNGVAMVLRMLCAVGAFALLRLTSDEDELFFMVSRPLSKVSLAFALATRLLPYIERRMKAVLDVQSVGRNAASKPKWTDYARTRAPLLRIGVSESLELSVNLAEAMYARGWDSGPRTAYPSEKPNSFDRATVFISASIAVFMLLLFAKSGIDQAAWPYGLLVFLPIIPYMSREMIR